MKITVDENEGKNKYKRKRKFIQNYNSRKEVKRNTKNLIEEKEENKTNTKGKTSE